MLNRHKHDNRKMRNGKNRQSAGSNGRNAGPASGAGSRDGNAQEENPDVSGTNLAQTGSGARARRACFCCGSLDHLLPDCPYKTTRPRDQWHRPDKYREFNALQTEDNNQSNQERSMLQTGSNTTQDTTTSNGRNNVQWSFVQAGRFLSTHNGNTNKGLSFQHRLNDDDDSSFVNIDEGRSNAKDFEL